MQQTKISALLNSAITRFVVCMRPTVLARSSPSNMFLVIPSLLETALVAGFFNRRCCLFDIKNFIDMKTKDCNGDTIATVITAAKEIAARSLPLSP